MDSVALSVKNYDGTLQQVEFPTGINLNLMEGLRASGYDIQATCGGMALCATCHVNVIAGSDQLNPPAEAELEMLDTLPRLLAGSRLSCQIRIEENIDNISIELVG